MPDQPAHLNAAAIWIQYGVTSTRNPIHQFLLETLFHPFGLRCEYMEADVIGSSDTARLPTFSSPRWSAELVAVTSRGLLPPDDVLRLFSISVDCGGRVRFDLDELGNVPHHQISVVDAFENGRQLNEMIGACRRAASAFLVRAFRMACLPDSEPQATEHFLRDPQEFAQMLWAAA
jgi:hypothetical protein